MHDDEISSDARLVAALLAEQVPALAGVPVTPVPSAGTDNALYRVGTAHVARLPRRPSAVALLEKELRWLPRLGPLPLALPEPVAAGRPGARFPHPFGVLRWVEGEPAAAGRLADPVAAAAALARFLAALRAQGAAGAPLSGAANHRRGVALAAVTAEAHAAIDALADEIDARRARALWDAALAAPVWAGPPVWLHGDLRADNLIAQAGRLVGVIDWGLMAAGDPAADVAAAWTWATPAARPAFRAALGLDDAAWARGRGWALYGAAIALAHYRGGRNPALARTSRRTLAALGLA